MNTLQTLVLASGNKGKLNELNELLKSCGYDVTPQSSYSVPEAEESGTTFVENAIIKARNACAYSGLPAIADDSGIEVDALNGAPGVFSARYAGAGAGDVDNNKKLLEELSGIADAQRTARYQCVLVFMRHKDDPTPLICQASWEGRILTKLQGEGGFGYDPLFWVPELNCSAAQLEKKEKNTISHRGQALNSLLSKLKLMTIS